MSPPATMESFDLMSSDHFHVVLHPNREHGIIFNRLDGTVTTINYNDAKELTNLKLIARTYGIVGRFLTKYLVLIKSCSRVGTLYEPETKTDHDIFVINQVDVIDISVVSPTQDSNISTNASSRSNNIDSVRYDASPSAINLAAQQERLEEHELRETRDSDEFSSLPITISTSNYNSAQSRAAQWNPFRLANSLKPIVTSQISALTGHSSTQRGEIKSKNESSNECDGQSLIRGQQLVLDDADKRLAEEMLKLFNNTNSFYFSPTLDLTNRFSKKCPKIRMRGDEPLWKSADERFFWNWFMLKDLIELSKQDTDANYFICIILQGFIAIQQSICLNHIQRLPSEEDSLGMIKQSTQVDDIEVGRVAIESTAEWRSSADENSENENNPVCDKFQAIGGYETKITTNDKQYSKKDYSLALVSRRSVFQAGTRYRRRGCDEEGNCANFVETEQIFKSNQHFTSLVIIRGSIPLFWHQSASLNYRPPPILTRSEDENQKALRKHYENLFYSYQTEQIVSVDCTEHTGREKALHESFRKHIEKLQEIYKKIKLVEFDFHKHCRGRQCNDAQIEQHLTAYGLDEQVLKNVQYYWNDGEVVWNQEGVFRVNCLDCSDRTNVVQRHIALRVLDLQLARLGIISPDIYPADNVCRRMMQTMWSTNGNVLSTQYCGTPALFGGDSKKLTGYLKDTYSSASRYYMSKFRDVYRQAAIDAMLGVDSIETKNLKSGNVRDQYELLNLDPILAGGRHGGALLRDMGNRVGSRLARLRGKIGQSKPFGPAEVPHPNTIAATRFNVYPSSASLYTVRSGSTAGISAMTGRHGHLDDDNKIIETGLIETLGEMSIDWPNSESMENLEQHTTAPSGEGNDKVEDRGGDVFARFSNCDDCFQDDDFGQFVDDYH